MQAANQKSGPRKQRRARLPLRKLRADAFDVDVLGDCVSHVSDFSREGNERWTLRCRILGRKRRTPQMRGTPTNHHNKASRMGMVREGAGAI
ncbi:hypothetical protein GCM10010985_30220 [Caballeronia grimmiae]|uniref:Uncharacterized protein n=1 Tax=Caballeronia grimmiae TaxID=1071679 RepID=A0ABQ1RL42_9BURK|nr:hypothetical protein GCM10010985_30220 [Caballeronia grimmiae]